MVLMGRINTTEHGREYPATLCKFDIYSFAIENSFVEWGIQTMVARSGQVYLYSSQYNTSVCYDRP